MKEIIIKTQKQYDALKDDVNAYIYIEGGTEKDPLTIGRALPNAYVYIRGSATIEYVYDSATIEYVSGSATIKSVSGSATIKSVYDSATIKYVYGSATIKSVYDSATIKSVYDSATIKSVYGSATIKSVYDSATIKYVYGSATIEYVSGSATIKSVYDSATIKSVSGSATIKSVYGSATIEYVYDSATIEYVSGSAKLPHVAGIASVLMVTGYALVQTFGHNIVRTVNNEKNTNITISENTTLVTIDESIKNPVTFDDFKNLYPVESTKTKAILYKAVHKKNGKYIANYDKTTEYIIGKVTKGKIDLQHTNTCSVGLHVAHKRWAINFGGWNDMALLECEVPIKSIVVASDTDGKVRTSELKVLREVPREEW